MEDIEKWFHAYKQDVYRLAMSYTKSPQDAQDVCQNVFLKLLQQPSIQPGREKAWLMQVTANQCRNLLRSAWWRQTAPLADTIPAPEGSDGAVYQAVMALTPKYRVVVFLYYYEGYATREIAQLLHIRQTAVTTRLSRARQMLHEALKEESI